MKVMRSTACVPALGAEMSVEKFKSVEFVQLLETALSMLLARDLIDGSAKVTSAAGVALPAVMSFINDEA